MESPTNEELLTAQVTVLLCAVEALISNHPNKEQVKQTFDLRYGQIQAGLLTSGTTPLGTSIFKDVANVLFSSLEKP